MDSRLSELVQSFVKSEYELLPEKSFMVFFQKSKLLPGNQDFEKGRGVVKIQYIMEEFCLISEIY